MKKSAFLTAFCLLALAGAVYAAGNGGSASNPLISLSYLNGTYTAQVDAQVDQRLTASDQALLERASGQTQGGAGDGAACASVWTETRLKQADRLLGSIGTNVMVQAGSVQVSFSSGAVVDVTVGDTVPNGTVLTPRHRYMVAEDTSAVFAVTSPTAVINYQGNYAFSYSDSVDFNAVAAALRQLNLFRGSGVAYGEGYDLETAPTRIQALIMFLRVLGEEDAALAYGGACPFTDIAAGSSSAKYAAYAYAKGYTNGVSKTRFNPSQTISVHQYTEFMLRALGYSSTATTDLSDTLTRALDSDVINARELAMLQSGPFLRAQLAYISYYALDATVANTDVTLGQALMDKNVFTAADRSTAYTLAPALRLS